MVRRDDWHLDTEKETFPYFISHCVKILQSSDIEEWLEEVFAKVLQSMTEFLREGSGWVFDHVVNCDLNVSAYVPLLGSSYIPLPPKLAAKQAIINIKNNDDKCFLWSVLAFLHPAKDQAHRVFNYLSHQNNLNVSGLEFPLKLNDVRKFETLNSVSVNVFGYEDGEVFPRHVTTNKFDKHVNLLLISSGDKQHYCLIKDFDRLMHSSTKHDGKKFYCMYCLHRFYTERARDEHDASCRVLGPQKIKFPEGEDRFLRFKNYHHQLPVPYYILADFECIIEKIDHAPVDQATSSTTKVAKHVPVSFCYAVVGPHGKLIDEPVLYSGHDCVNVFLGHLEREGQEIRKLKQENVSMIFTHEDKIKFYSAINCGICEKPLNGDKVRDHDHLTGLFRHAAHNECNINYKFKDFVPVVCHNLRGYDSHLIMQEIGKFKNVNITCIANNVQKYISFSFGDLRFLDSYQFMSESLERLASNLDSFTILDEHFKGQDTSLLKVKGVFPYEYFDSLDRFTETCLPPPSAFRNVLKNDDISEADYAHAQTVWKTFKMTSFKQYHDLYLKTDVLLLVDVFQNFRRVCLNCYGLDPLHYFTSPGLAWDACLKKSGVTLELLTDPDMHMFFENGTRGGISMVSNRHAKANNKHLPDYDSSTPSSHIMYLDANNLYGWALSQPLPTGDFKWLDDVSKLDVTTISTDGDEGFILEVDLEYPAELHDSHSDYPLAPERMAIPENLLSDYSKSLLASQGSKHHNNIPKLVPNLFNKTKYILHYRNLQFYISQGMIVTKTHRILQFQQSPWLKTYIDFNTAQRTLSKNDFEKNFYKLMNNAVFGKTMENLRKRQNVKLVQTDKKFKKLAASPAFSSFRIFNEDLVGVQMLKTTLLLNRPIYVGFTVLDNSKILMYDFFYNQLKSRYGERVKLMFTDTDSLAVQIFTDDIYQDMASFSDLLDTSDYPTDHFLHSNTNKKVIGMFKDELNGIPLVELVALRSKMYGLKPLRGPEKKTAKGVSRTVVRQDYRVADYKSVLFDRQTRYAHSHRIQSVDHNIFTMDLVKLGLSAVDDKRYILDNGCDTLAHGHYRISEPMECD